MELILRGELGKPVRGVLELQLEIGTFYASKRGCDGSKTNAGCGFKQMPHNIRLHVTGYSALRPLFAGR